MVKPVILPSPPYGLCPKTDSLAGAASWLQVFLCVLDVGTVAFSGPKAAMTGSALDSPDVVTSWGWGLCGPPPPCQNPGIPCQYYSLRAPRDPSPHDH